MYLFFTDDDLMYVIYFFAPPKVCLRFWPFVSMHCATVHPQPKHVFSNILGGGKFLGWVGHQKLASGERARQVNVGVDVRIAS